MYSLVCGYEEELVAATARQDPTRRQQPSLRSNHPTIISKSHNLSMSPAQTPALEEGEREIREVVSKRRAELSFESYFRHHPASLLSRAKD